MASAIARAGRWTVDAGRREPLRDPARAREAELTPRQENVMTTSTSARIAANDRSNEAPYCR